MPAIALPSKFETFCLHVFLDNNIKSSLVLDASKKSETKYLEENGYKINRISNLTDGIGLLNNKVSAIICRESLFHLNDREVQYVISEFYRVLKPEGILIIQVRSIHDPEYKHNIIENNSYRHFFSSDYMREKLHRFNVLSLREHSPYTKDSMFLTVVAKKSEC